MIVRRIKRDIWKALGTCQNALQVLSLLSSALRRWTLKVSFDGEFCDVKLFLGQSSPSFFPPRHHKLKSAWSPGVPLWADALSFFWSGAILHRLSLSLPLIFVLSWTKEILKATVALEEQYGGVLAKAAVSDMKSAAQQLSGEAAGRGATWVWCLLDEVFLQEWLIYARRKNWVLSLANAH